MSASKLLEQLPVEPAAGPAWLVEVRREAAETLRAAGLPHRKVEAWRHTPVKPIVDGRYAPAPEAEVPASALERLAADDGTHRVYLVNGRLVPGAALPAGVSLETLTEQDRAPVTAGQHFAALNAALFDAGVVVRIARGAVVEAPLHLVHVAVPSADATVCYPRILIAGGENSQATVVETYVAAADGVQLCNAVTEVELERAAQLSHTRVQLGAEGSSLVASLGIRQAAASVYRSCSVSFGGSFHRVDIRAALRGEGAECNLDGVYHTTGREVCDHHTLIEHIAPRCSSSETYRGIVDGASHAVFDGIIVVKPGAGGTSAHQENRNLLLSDDASIHTKPHLEIDTDDLVASHGATIGALDDAQLFYLRARGLHDAVARAALTYGFAAEVIEGIGHRPTAVWLETTLRQRLPDGERIAELLQ